MSSWRPRITRVRPCGSPSERPTEPTGLANGGVETHLGSTDRWACARDMNHETEATQDNGFHRSSATVHRPLCHRRSRVEHHSPSRSGRPATQNGGRNVTMWTVLGPNSRGISFSFPLKPPKVTTCDPGATSNQIGPRTRKSSCARLLPPSILTLTICQRA